MTNSHCVTGVFGITSPSRDHNPLLSVIVVFLTFLRLRADDNHVPYVSAFPKSPLSFKNNLVMSKPGKFLHFYLRIDGLSIGTILLTRFITTLETLEAWPVTRDSRLFHF
uniref:Uncharacterized protein n=1 Tax=Solanum lycopersicum TaxID=4081 RepID=A0A3Q7EYS4_SOLLC